MAVMKNADPAQIMERYLKQAMTDNLGRDVVLMTADALDRNT